MTETLLSDSQLKALLKLLDEEDRIAYEHVAARLRQVLACEPERVEALVPTLEPEVRRQVEDFLEETRWEFLERRMKALARLSDERFPLEQGLHLLDISAYPGLHLEGITARLDELARRLRAKLGGEQSPVRALQIMAEFLFQEEGFRPNEADYYDPDNNYFHRVLERKLGIPITLSCLYIFLGRRVHLPFQGIGLPGHFIVQLTPPSARPGAEGQRYYVDPYHKGQILTLAQCRQILSRQGIAQAPKYFSPVTDRAILARVIANLIRIYESRGNPLRSERLTRLFSSLEAR